MSRAFFLLILVFFSSFIAGCGGGGSGGEVSPSSINPASSYRGIKTAADVNEDNYQDLVKSLFGNTQVSNVFTYNRTSDTQSEILVASGNKINTTLISGFLLYMQSKLDIQKRDVNETVYCETGNARITGTVNDNTRLGRLTAIYSNCTLQEVTIDGTVIMDIHAYNATYGSLQDYTISYESLSVTESNSSYTTTATTRVTYDFPASKVTTVENVLTNKLGKQVLFEGFTSLIDSSGNISLSGKLYHEDYGYIIISTVAPIRYGYSNPFYPETGGPLLLQAGNQTLRLSTQGQGNQLEVEYIDNEGGKVRTIVGDLAPFTISLISGTTTTNGIENNGVDEVKLQLSEGLNLADVELSDIQIKDENGILVPSQVTYDSNTYIVTITPDSSLDHLSQYHIELSGSWSSVSDKGLQFDIPINFATASDDIGPKIISITPTDGDNNLSIDTSFVIEFNEDINPSLISVDDDFLEIKEGYYYYKDVPTTAVVSGSKITIIPQSTLLYGQEYKLSLRGAYDSEFRDLQGNKSYIYDEWLFQTQEYGTKIDVGVGIDYFEVDKTNNKLYALDRVNKSLLVIDLTTDQLENTYQLIQKPSQFCIDEGSDRIYFTTLTSSFIEEYRLSDFSKITSIPWSSKSHSSSDVHFHIQCTANKLFVTDGEWSPELYSIERLAPYTETVLSGIESVGDFYLSQTGDIYTWFQYGWSAGLAGSNVRRYQESQSGWSMIDESTKGYPEHDRDPLDSPIIVSEDRGIVLNKRYIFNSLNLEQVMYDFGEDAVIYDVDFSHDRVATLDKVYSLDNYSKLLDIPIVKADGVFFDNEGDLYILKNDRSAVYMIPENEL